MAGDYLVTLVSFGRFIRWGNPSYLRFLKSRNYIIGIFMESTGYCPYFSQIIPKSSIGNCLQRAENSEVEERM